MDCVRGCTHYRRHLSECRVDDHQTETWIPSSVDLDDEAKTKITGIRNGQYGGQELCYTCTGCKPRHASHGQLCTACHNRLQDQIRRIPWLDTWLTLNIQPSVGAQSEKLSRSKIAGSPAPGRIPIWDTRQLLRDRTLEVEEILREEFRLNARQTPFNIRASAEFIGSWTDKAETELDPDVLTHITDLIFDVFRQARQVAPWEDRPKQLSGIPCWNEHCGKMRLVIMPGDIDVTCLACHQTIDHQDYTRWVNVLAQDHRHVNAEGMTVA